MAINTIKATIQMRKGLERDFDADQMTAGEWAVSTDVKYVRMCFMPGLVLRMATYEGFEADMVQVREILNECQDIQVAVDAMADIVEQHKDDAEAYAKLSESWAKGGTGVRPNEDLNNSAYLSSLSQSYAKGTGGQVRPGDDEDSAKGYYEKTRQIAQSANGLIPMGTIAFADLPTSNILQGAMYNISDDFTSDNRFIDGGGKYYGAGSNIYWVATEQKWDVTAPSAVYGVKGDNETSYRQGLVNITPADIGAATIEDMENVNPDYVGTKEDLDAKIASGDVEDGATAYLYNYDGYSDGYEPNRVIVTDENGMFTESVVTSEELGFLTGATSNIQGQFDDIQEQIGDLGMYVADKETLDKIYNLLSVDPIYGFIEHNDILSSSSRIEYIGANKDYNPITITKGGGYSLGDWADFPILKANKPWMVKSDGTPDYRLSESDYTKKEDNQTTSDVSNTSYNGGTFSWLMKIYKQEYMVGTDRVVKFSFRKRDGFEAVGFIDPDGKELEGVWIPMFYGSVVDGTMKSISGTQPDYNKTTDAQKTAIDAFGSRAKFFGGSIVETITDLLLMWGKDSNTENVYGYGNHGGYNPALSPTYGVKANAVIGGGQFYGTSDGSSLNKILHSIVLGSWQQWMRDPYTLCVNGRVRVSKNYGYDLTGASYEDTGISYPANANGAYPHEYRSVPGFGALHTYPYKGSSITGGCDGFWLNIGITAVARRFGTCDAGSLCGSRALLLSGSAAFATWGVGCAVLLLPPVGVAA